MLVGKKCRKYVRDVKVIPWELQVIKKSEKATDHRKKDLKLNENQTRVKFEKRVKRTNKHRRA